MRLSNSNKLVAIEFNGFIAIPAGTRLTFILSPEVLGCVDTCAQRVRRSRADLLLAMIVGKEIDPESAIFVEADVVEAKSTYYGPLVFEYRVDGEDLGLQLDATQDLRAMPEGEVCTVLIEIAHEAGN